MATIGELIVRFGLDTSAFSEGIERLNKDLGTMQREVSRNFGNIRTAADNLQSVGTTLSASVTLPVVAFGAAAIRAGGEIDALRRGLAAVTSSAEAAGKQFIELREVAKLPGLGLKEALQGATRLQAIGYEADEAKRILLQFGNAIAMVGGGRVELAGVITQLQQMGAKAKVAADDLKPIINNVPMVGKAIKELYGTVDTKEIQEMGIAPRRLIEDVLVTLEKLPRVMGGLKNDLENLGDTVTIAMSDVGMAMAPVITKIVDVLVPAIETAANAFTSLAPETQEFVIAAAGIAAVVGPAVFAIGALVNSAIQIGSALGLARAGITALSTVAVSGAAGVTQIGIGMSAAAMQTTTAATAIGGTSQTLVQSLLGIRGASAAASAAVATTSGAITTTAVPAFAMLDTGIKASTVTFGLWMSAITIGIPAAIYAIYKLISAFDEAGNALRREVDANNLAASSHDRLRDSLITNQHATREQRQEVRRLYDEYKAGQITEQQYMQGMQKIGKAIGDVTPQKKQATKATNDFSSALEKASKSAEKVKVKLDPVQQALQRLYQLDHQNGINRIAEALYLVGKHGSVAAANIALMEGALREIPKVVSEMPKVSDIFGNLKVDPNQQIKEALDVEWTYRTLSDLSTRTNKTFNVLFENLKKGWKDQNKVAKEAMRQVSLVLTDLSRDLSNLIVKGGSLKEVVVGAIEALGKALLRMAIEQTFKGILSSMQGMVAQIPGLSKIGELFGGVSKAAAATPGIVGSVTGAASKATEAIKNPVSSILGGGITGIIGAVGSVGSMISGIIGNFQNARQETTLNAIEWNTRKSSLHLEHMLGEATTYWPWMENIAGRLWHFTGHGLGVLQYGEWKFPTLTIQQPPVVDVTPSTLSTTSIGNQFNFAGAYIMSPKAIDDFVDILVSRLRARGAIA